MQFKDLISIILDDLKVYSNNRKSLIIKIVIFFTNPSFQLLANYRISYYLKDTPFSFFNIIIRYINNWFMSSEISPYAELGSNLQFPHPSGIIIGYGAVIKDNVTIFQQVTLGAQGRPLAKNKEYPVISSGVVIYAKASVVGPIVIRENCIIGAHSLVVKDTEANSTYVGVPAKKVPNV